MKKFISSLLALVILISLVSCSKSTEVTTTLETTTVPTTTTTEATTTTTTEATTNYNDYLENELDLLNVEYQTYEIPYQFSNNSMRNIYSNTCRLEGFAFAITCLGYDNLMIRNALINDAYNQTGEYNPEITIDNYRYFLYYSNGSYSMSDEGFYSQCNGNLYSFTMPVARAVCSQEGLRFAIDEIPSSYFYERFPEFMRMLENGQSSDLWLAIEEAGYETVQDVSSVTDQYQRDILEFFACMQYNRVRTGFIFNYNGVDEDYSNDVDQVRDLRNNRHVLLPTEEQYNNIMENLHEIPTFENIDIYRVETREEYFNAYGVYPEDVLSEERYDLNYEPYVSPYEFDVVQIDENIEQPES